MDPSACSRTVAARLGSPGAAGRIASQAAWVVVATVLLAGCGKAGEAGSGDLAGHAAQWARATDFATRFPSAKLTIQTGQETAIATFTDADGEVRAELTYAKAAEGWALQGLHYC